MAETNTQIGEETHQPETIFFDEATNTQTEKPGATRLTNQRNGTSFERWTTKTNDKSRGAKEWGLNDVDQSTEQNFLGD